MKKYNFNEIVPREGTNCIKYDAREWYFKTNDVLPLWVADMDFKTPDFIVEAIKKRAEHEIFGYTFRPDSYFQSIIGWMKSQHDWEIQKEWISFSPGVVSALTFAIQTFSKPGDGVVVQPPVYFPFFDCVKGTKRKMVENPLKIENGRYTFDFEDLKQKIDENTKILLLCNPQNPGGTVWTRTELEELANICHENKIMIVSDEIHSDLVFNGHKHIPIASISDEVAQNCMVCMAPSKTFNVAGLASSMVIIPNKCTFARYEKAIGIGHLGMGNIFGSVALQASFSNGDEWLNQMLDYVWKNYLFLEDFFKTNLPKIKVMKPEATFLVWLDFTAYEMNDKELWKFTTEKAKVGLNNGGRFGSGGDGWLRINIGCPRSILEEALKMMGDAFR
ncbi:MAG: putative C-S lyase [Prolixibacteraceae bacterium]|jgi:cysteine-S-conjugate beta-lyase|nr:putative C-S lyase [Prolixibacteraceae bacterium]MBT6007558.1 putative C-S lyase [Prolixibacteraceae bacterium]MBT6767094.1 putative C-S lyase [Prolixibacteraceae bacterium]MBT7000104.1 putative C-S lyase [Prolixibacteraceae bacterium]MBT7395012.1 putative C-S lyase [Prolixibacteraceae bacterium]